MYTHANASVNLDQHLAMETLTITDLLIFYVSMPTLFSHYVDKLAKQLKVVFDINCYIIVLRKANFILPTFRHICRGIAHCKTFKELELIFCK